MTLDSLTRAFTAADGRFRFARWARPVVPMVYGVDDASMAVLKSGVTLICDLTGHPMADSDPDFVHNHVSVYLRDWDELRNFPGQDLSALAKRLADSDADQHRVFRFDAQGGGIVQCLQAVRLRRDLAEVPVALLALGQAMAAHLHWGPQALAGGVTEQGPDGPQIRTDLLRLLRAAYDPALPAASTDPAFALRLAARMAA